MFLLGTPYIYSFVRFLQTAKDLSACSYFVLLNFGIATHNTMSSPSSDEEPESPTTGGAQKHETTATLRKQKQDAAGPPESPTSTTKRSSKDRSSGKGVSLASLFIFSWMLSPANPIGYVVTTAQEFAIDSIRLVRRCTKPDAKGEQKLDNISVKMPMGAYTQTLKVICFCIFK